MSAIKRRPFLTLGIAIILLAVLGLLAFDTSLRQMITGPRFNGVPLRAWQQFFRDHFSFDPDQPRKDASTYDYHEAFFRWPDEQAWRGLSGEDRRTILLSLTDDSRPAVRSSVARYLVDVPVSPEVVVRLKRFTRDEDPHVRASAVHSLGVLRPPLTESVPDLLTFLDDPDFGVSNAAGSALGEIGSRAPAAVLPGVLGLLESPGKTKHLNALRILHYMRTSSPTAAAAVLMEMDSSEPRIRESALLVLGDMRVKEAVPEVLRALLDPEPRVRRAAVYAAGMIGAPASKAVPLLVERLKALDPEEGSSYRPELTALGRLGGAAREAIPCLLMLCQHPSEEVSKAAESTLREIDSAGFPPKQERM
jgi:hypothetical protein